MGLPLVLVPALAVLAARRRARPVLAALQLDPPPWGSALALALAAATASALLVVAAARPAIVRTVSARVRTDAQLYVVLDTSRSMSARATPTSPTRLERAQAFAIGLQADLPEVPAGVASFTDRVLPAAMPTVDGAAFDATVRLAIGIDRPPAQWPTRVATSYTALQDLPEGGSFAPGARRRLLVVLTDGESGPYGPKQVVSLLRRLGTGLLVVRFWQADERVFAGRRAVSYRPDPASTPVFDALGARAVGGRVFGEHDVAAAAAAARGFFGTGPTATARSVGRPVALGPYAALLGFAGLALLALRRGGGRRRASRSAGPWPVNLDLIRRRGDATVESGL